MEAEKPLNGASQPVHLARTLGPGSIIFMGIGCLIGGGIFTLLGPAAGLAGPGLFLAMILGSGVAFLNLQMYLALGTTFPEAGGGYLWVRKGLGNFQGFMGGWFSWFAHAAACGTYALSLAFYGYELLHMVGFDPGISVTSFMKAFAVALILLFGYLNWRGTKNMGNAGIIITGGLLVVLLGFIVSGLARIGAAVHPLANFSPFLPHGFFGIIAATAFFYIAFEGSEIQVQAGEETKNPAHDLKIGLITSWAIVSVLYVLISFVVIGATPAAGGEVYKVLSGFGEGAIVRAAESFMPWGALLMTIGGFLANLAALNATIFSSSHVAFAMARDNNIWSRMSRVHLKNFTPDLAVIVSTLLVCVMVVALPLFDVASAASLLFVLLFLQLNLAGINIHFKFPDTRWKYRIPFFPVTPIVAIVLYGFLAASMLKTNMMAWLVTGVWMLLGLINYFAYAARKGREQFEAEIVYEEQVRIGPKTGQRLLLPIMPSATFEDVAKRLETAVVLASHLKGEIIILMVHEVPQPLMLLDGATMTHDRQMFDSIKRWVEEFNERTPGIDHDVNFHNLAMVGRDVTDTILEVVKMEDCDLLMLSWKGYTRVKGTVFGSKIDRILREAHCDLLVFKDPKPVTSVILAANPKGKNPSLKLIGEIYSALNNHYRPKTELFCVLGKEVPVYLKTDPAAVLAGLGLKKKDVQDIKFASSGSITKALIEEVGRVHADLVIVGAAKPKFLKDIRFGSIPESLAKHLEGSSLMIVKAHQSVAEALGERVRDFLTRRPKDLPPAPPV